MQDLFAKYKSGHKASVRTITAPRRKTYEFVNSDADSRCHYCQGYWVTWVAFGLVGTRARAEWQLPNACSARSNFYACPTKACSAQLKVEDEQRKPNKRGRGPGKPKKVSSRKPRKSSRK